ncbi:MAG: M20 family metallopeptidase [Actinomycetota bacterium]|nr:M20 family metallopeptidase [Actinomycetota bacterium]
MTASVADIQPFVNRDRLFARLRSLVQLPSENPPGNEAAVARLAAEMCEEMGLDTSLHEGAPNRPSIVARWTGSDGPTVSYCSHIDVIPAGDHQLWSVDPFGAEIRDGVMHGRGACDAKGPVAAALEAVAALRDAGFDPAGTLELQLVADEEAMGFKGTGYLVDRGIVSPDFAVVGEPTSLRVVRAQRGACWARITTRGVAGHGSAPERGVNAIRHMAEIILRLEEALPDITHPVLGGPSIGVGTISGGAKVNVVPASCVAEIDRRSLPSETQEDVIRSIEGAVDLASKRFPEIEAKVECAFYAPPFEVAENSPLVLRCREAVTETTGKAAQIMGFRGASDARFLAEAGADVVVMGPGDISLAHTARESVELEEVYRAGIAYALVFAGLLGG